MEINVELGGRLDYAVVKTEIVGVIHDIRYYSQHAGDGRCGPHDQIKHGFHEGNVGKSHRSDILELHFNVNI